MRRYLAAAALTLLATACGEREPSMADTALADGVEEADTASGDGMPVPPLIDLTRTAAPAVSTGRTTCHGITGFLYDADPAGRVVRAGPSAASAELGRIPPPQDSEEIGGGWPWQFDIIGSENGWLQISGARFDEDMGGTPSAEAYSGTGWIAAGGVHVGVQSRTGFAEPSHDAAVLISGYPDTELDGFGPQRVIACQGRWILADWPAELSAEDGRMTWRLNYRPEAVVRRDPVVLRAWVAGVCNIIETTCDSVMGDYPGSS